MNRLAYETATQNPAMPETEVKGWRLEKDSRLMGRGGGEGEADVEESFDESGTGGNSNGRRQSKEGRLAASDGESESFVDHLGELKEIPHITVADDGEISLYWNGNEVTVEVAFPSDGNIEYYVNKDGKRQAGELCLTPIGWRTEQAGALEDALSVVRA